MFREGQEIGLYTLIKRIGRGGFGEVWLAERRAKFVTTKVAVKLPLDEQVDHEAIKQEAVLWEQASGHPNVLPIIDADEYDGQIVIVSEYAPDGSLDELLQKEGVLPIKKAIELAMGILSGLDFLHSKKIIHRDVKPANILLQGETPRLADFGISRVMKTTVVSVTMSGTPSYMAPEAFDRKRNVQTDIWSVGVILYQMLKGSLPFPFNEMTDLLGAIIMKEPETLPDSVPPRLQEIVFKALSKKPEVRYQTAQMMRDDLADFLISISQSNLQPTLIIEKQPEKTEEKEEILPTVPVIETPSRESVDSFAEPILPTPPAVKTQPQLTENVAFVANTQDKPLAATIPSAKISELTNPASPKPKTTFPYFKVFAPIAVLILLTVGGLALFISRQLIGTNTNQNTNQSPTAKSADSQLIPFRKGDKFGFCDMDKKLVIEAKYDMVNLFYEGLAVVNIGGQKQKTKDGIEIFKGGKYGFIDADGKEIVTPKYDYVESFSEGLAAVNIGLQKEEAGIYTISPGKMGYIDKTGREVIPLKYDVAKSFKDGVAYVLINAYKNGEHSLEGKAGLIDKTGNEVVPIIYESFVHISFEDDLALVQLGDKFGFIDRNGRVVIPIIYDYAEAFSDGLALVGKGTKWKRTADIAASRLFPDHSNAKYGYIDKMGKEVIPFKYKFGESFYDGIASVQLNNKGGFIDKEGNTVIPFEYDSTSGFSKYLPGLAKVQIRNKTGLIDRNGNEVTGFKYDQIGYIDDGMAGVGIKVKNVEKWGFINSKGEEIVSPKYDNIYWFVGGLAAVNTGYQSDKNGNLISTGKWGFIDKNGKEVIPSKYDFVYSFGGSHNYGNTDYTLVTLNKKDFYIDRDGTEYYEP